MPQTPRVQLLLTGNELMSGDTVDSNSATIAHRLATLGLAVGRKVTLGDDPAALVAELAAMARDAEVVIVNGGLGPTVDDLTAAVVAEAAGLPLAEHPEALAHLERWCAGRGLPLDGANRKQALLPAGCTILPNARGSAVGFAVDLGSCRIYCTPGVPGELATMLEPVCDDLTERWPGLGAVDILRLQTFGLGESTAQQLIADDNAREHAAPWPPAVNLGFRAGAPQLEIKLAITDPAAAADRDACLARLEALFGDHIIGRGDASLAGELLALLRERGLTVATAESCTGGAIAAALTRVPGSSAAFEAGYVTYSNAIKTRTLGVREETLATHGAVSEAVVREMATGALERAGADLAVAVSGVAGPEGGTAAKPVGTVWLAWGDREQLDTVCLLWPVERTLFQTMVAALALDLLRRRLLALPPLPSYARQRRAA
ncbi:CinA family nicotinamide mononucleotide deamidase-related protein [Pseudohaliea rubra]|uniref:CinA-like protein n=1 Tax=Pseudohaliea rubra DSM 19751 TaxID=1265313 RepID=A0A095VQY2_9GAMM|nr:CinA family nicotinamide mononucleotide deamidase-related protein [Pseudohaliea rubra]KGE03872.1 C-terminal domain protein of CinA type S [Pseudohaliea rubra DSM 19751]